MKASGIKADLKAKDVRCSRVSSFFEVSRSVYYRRRSKNVADRDLGDYELIRAIFEERRGRVGIRQIQMLLERRMNLRMNHKKIARIKRKYGLETKIRRRNKHRYFAKKQQEHEVFANKLNRSFNVAKPDRVYSTDITEWRYGRGFKVYLAAFKDLCTKEILSYNVGLRSDIALTNQALDNLLSSGGGSLKNLMIHSDQGFQFTHFSFRDRLRSHKIEQSMSRRGNCLDNAPIESFFGHFKDQIDLSGCVSLDEARSVIEREINYYNNERPQLGLKKMPPAEYRRHLKV